MKKSTQKVRNSFSTREAAKISGVSHRTVDYWASTKLISPSISDSHGVGTDRRYNFEDLLLLRTARELRDNGITTQMLRAALDKLRELGYPKTDCRLVGVNSEVHIVRKGRLEEAISGQGVFAFMLDLRENRKAVEEQVESLAA